MVETYPQRLDFEFRMVRTNQLFTLTERKWMCCMDSDHEC